MMGHEPVEIERPTMSASQWDEAIVLIREQTEALKGHYFGAELLINIITIIRMTGLAVHIDLHPIKPRAVVTASANNPAGSVRFLTINFQLGESDD